MPDNSRVDQQGFNTNSRLRASDRDRDRAASVINEALAEGRLTAEEHSERLDAIYAAKTHAEIVPLLDDLPEQAAAATPAIPERKPVPAGRISRIICVLSGATRKGVWHPEPVTEVVAVLGGADLDFREAVLPAKEITLRVVTVLGGVSVVVPPEMRVIDSGVAVLGGREITGNSDDSVQPNAPVLHITGVSVLGGMDVKRKPRKKKH
jgi:Domain of unknown function (DUF1707)